jgi:hypothetical protein
MKAKILPKKSVSISNSRWTAYAAAGVASTLIPTATVEAEIHYSGLLNRHFEAPPGGRSEASFPLDNGILLHFLQTLHASSRKGGAYLNVRNADEFFAGKYVRYGGIYAAKLAPHISLSQIPFTGHCTTTTVFSNRFCNGAIIGLYFSGNGYWRDRGAGFIGFRFDSGQGSQYGWVRIKCTGERKFKFILVDYAWGDVGDSVSTGQKHSTELTDAVPASGSLGLLAVGALGLTAWRTQRSRNSRRSEGTQPN